MNENEFFVITPAAGSCGGAAGLWYDQKKNRKCKLALITCSLKV